MFSSCEELTKAPDLLAPVLVTHCYAGMFMSCGKLAEVKMMATTLPESGDCFNGWLANVSESGTFYKDSSMTELPEGTDGIPYGWTVIDAN
jgi:hypothetical protein